MVRLLLPHGNQCGVRGFGSAFGLTRILSGTLPEGSLRGVSGAWNLQPLQRLLQLLAGSAGPRQHVQQTQILDQVGRRLRNQPLHGLHEADMNNFLPLSSARYRHDNGQTSLSVPAAVAMEIKTGSDVIEPVDGGFLSEMHPGSCSGLKLAQTRRRTRTWTDLWTQRRRCVFF